MKKKGFTKHARKPQAFKPEDEWHPSFKEKIEAKKEILS